MYKFIPVYVGSKSHWVSRLIEFKGKPFVELFSGSAVLSANLASEALLNDKDEMIYKILKNFTELTVPETFTETDYFQVRGGSEWWRYIYCLQKMCFSGVFRYSKNGYNVPIKKNLKPVQARAEYEESKIRYLELNPVVLNKSYDEIALSELEGRVVVLDPPYEGSQASYNDSKAKAGLESKRPKKKGFDYDKYWEHVRLVCEVAEVVIVFDAVRNLQKQGIPVYMTRKMRVNGARPGDEEGLAIFEKCKSAWRNPPEVVQEVTRLENVSPLSPVR